MFKIRCAGILLPVFSLPSEYGIGCLSGSAYKFIDFLKKSGQKYWQILPLCPTSYGDSPYQSPSSFAGNPYMISLKELVIEGLLKKEECDKADFGKNPHQIDYEKLYNNRYPILRLAFSRFKPDEYYTKFEQEQEYWLSDYALFMAIKNRYGGAVWTDWEDSLRYRNPSALNHLKKELAEEISFIKFLQYKFYTQWKNLKKYANSLGISIIGDIPIYTSFDSSDVWANPELFQLDKDRQPLFVAGCPPDGFSGDGQLWGNPVYKWHKHKETDFSWWISRIKHCFSLYDAVRIDHFRGFDEFYKIPYGSKNAKIGSWEEGPGIALFSEVKKQIKNADIIAEDLGFITDSVKKLVTDTGFPGMKVLEFAFDSRDSGFQSDYLPHNYPENSVCYTGTHDNQTVISWLSDISDEEIKKVRDYLCDYYTPQKELHLPLISSIMQSKSKLCIIPIQDYIGLDDSARINTPSTLGTNWKWRLDKTQLSDELIKTIRTITECYGRI